MSNTRQVILTQANKLLAMRNYAKNGQEYITDVRRVVS